MSHLFQLTFVGVFCITHCAAQDLCGLTRDGIGFRAPSTESAFAVLDRIAKVVPFESRTIRLLPSNNDAVARKGGAAAQLCNATERWIFYDPTYVDRIAPIDGQNLARYFVLAHEVAHHVNGDTFYSEGWRKDQELAADCAASVWLGRLGARLEDVLRTFDSLGLPTAAVNGYPTASERRSKVIDCYEPAKVVDDNKLPPEYRHCNRYTAPSSNNMPPLWLAFINIGSQGTDADVEVSLFDPSDTRKAFVSTRVPAGSNLNVGSKPIDNRWGISINNSCPVPIGSVSTYYVGKNWQARGTAKDGIITMTNRVE